MAAFVWREYPPTRPPEEVADVIVFFTWLPDWQPSPTETLEPPSSEHLSLVEPVSVSNHDPLDLVETDLIAPAIVELGRPR